ncbi:MAG: AI-2E family transporter [Eubacteriales bacterium]|nr:AI-2E family transporter [Eubacteriales bacterium]
MDMNYRSFIKLSVIVGSVLAVVWYMPEVIRFVGIVFSYLIPFIIGLSIAFVLNVLMKIIEEKFVSRLKVGKYQRMVAFLLTLITMIMAVVILVLLIIPEIRNTFTIVSQNFPSFLKSIESWLSTLRINDLGLSDIEFNWESLMDSAYDFITRGGGGLFSTTWGITSSILGVLINMALGLVFSIYILFQKESLGRQTRKLLHAFLSEGAADSILDVGALANEVFSNFIKGQFFEALIIGILCFVGMTVLSMPYAVAISALVGFTALIPLIGAFVGTGIGVFLIVMVEPIKALWFVVFIVVLQQVESNLIYPRVVGTSVGLPGIWVLLAVTVGAASFGILGILVAVPISSVLYSLLRRAVDRRLSEKGRNI